MNPETKISQADLARHWGVSKPYVSQLGSRKGMPPFRNLADADTWRALNAPPKPALEAVRSSSESGQSREKNRGSSQPPRSADNDSASAGGANFGGDLVDIEPFRNRVGDFDTIMVKDAEEMPLIARGLFDRACRNHNLAEIANLLKIWNDAAGKARDARQGFLDILERRRNLISIDEVMDTVGTELQAVRSALLKLGARFAAKANPSDPVLAQTVIDGAVDEILRNFTNGMELAQRELAEGKTDPTAPDNAALGSGVFEATVS